MVCAIYSETTLRWFERFQVVPVTVNVWRPTAQCRALSGGGSALFLPGSSRQRVRRPREVDSVSAKYRIHVVPAIQALCLGNGCGEPYQSPLCLAPPISIKWTLGVHGRFISDGGFRAMTHTYVLCVNVCDLLCSGGSDAVWTCRSRTHSWVP